MKTTLDLNDSLVRNAKVLAAQEGSSLTRLVEEGLRLRLFAKSRAGRATRVVKLPVSRCKGGLLPGIDPTRNSSMLDAADGI